LHDIVIGVNRHVSWLLKNTNIILINKNPNVLLICFIFIFIFFLCTWCILFWKFIVDKWQLCFGMPFWTKLEDDFPYY